MRGEYDFWLLDLDGTLVDVETSYVHEVGRNVGDRLGVSFSARQAEHLWYGFGDTRDRVFAETGVDREQFWATFHDVDDPDARAAATHIYPDAAAFVGDIDVPTGLVTHCQTYLTEPILEILDIADWFDTVVCCDDETGWKPDPRPLELAMTDLGVAGNGHTGAMVGDDPSDIDAAHNAGLDAIHVDRHNFDRLGGHVDGGQRVPALTDLLEG
jgi:phosphoglycolate phosphatase